MSERAGPKPSWWRRLIQLSLIGAAVMTVASLLVLASACETMGATATGARHQRMEASPQWGGEGFTNPLPRVDGDMSEMTSQWLFGGSDHRFPVNPLPVQMRTRESFKVPPTSGLRTTWLGHSTLIVEIDGARVLIDPVWGERASPFSWLGPARWYAPPLPLEDLPPVDVVVISHDHYDHLDHSTVVALLGRKMTWVVPLGIGAHLTHWGVPAEQIVELDWWEATQIGDVEFTCTPARHFSGRSLTDQNATLWAGWSMAGPTHKVFYSGDTAMHDTFVDIGEKLGPFDLTLIESGAYNTLWADVHLGPEQAVRAHQLVKGKVLLPVHWGLFDLALHGWTEPMERVLAAAKRSGVKVVMPRPGASVELGVDEPTARWWPDLPWQTLEEAPAFSSKVEHLLERATAPAAPPNTATTESNDAGSADPTTAAED